MCCCKTQKVIKLKSPISKATKDDEHKGWIRVSENLRKDIPNGSYVKIKANKREVYCQIRGTPRKEGRIEINEWYRNALGWNDPPKRTELTIQEVRFLGRFQAFSYHPDDIVRISIGLGIISVGLGLLSIVMACLPPIIRLLASGDFVGGIASLIPEIFLTLLVVFILCQGIWTAVPKLHKPIK